MDVPSVPEEVKEGESVKNHAVEHEWRNIALRNVELRNDMYNKLTLQRLRADKLEDFAGITEIILLASLILNVALIAFVITIKH